MLAICQFDAASASVLRRLLDEGRLPTLAGLRDRGPWHQLEAPATAFAAGAQHTLYSGVELADHGLFYPFQWDPAEQRVRYMDAFPAPTPVWERLGTQGTRTLAVDPYESRAPERPVPGSLVCGWQLHDRVVLREWSSPEGTHARLERLFGTPEPVDEVFGPHTAPEMLGLRRRLLGAPGRVADAFELLLPEQDFALAWTTFCAAHVAGHQFWDLSQIEAEGLDADAERVLGSTLDDVYAAVDAALGRVVAALPPGADLMVVSPVGMEVNTSRADLLPEVLRAILDPRPEAVGGDAETMPSSIWRLRAALPSGLRARVANALPERAALDLTAKLEMRGVDWSTHPGLRPPGREPGLRPAQPAGPRARRHRRPGRRRRPAGRAHRRHPELPPPRRHPGGGLDRAGGRPVRLRRPVAPAARPPRPLGRHPGHVARRAPLRALRHRAPPRRGQRPLRQPHRGRRLGPGGAGQGLAGRPRARRPGWRTWPPPP